MNDDNQKNDEVTRERQRDDLGWAHAGQEVEPWRDDGIESRGGDTGRIEVVLSPPSAAGDGPPAKRRRPSLVLLLLCLLVVAILAIVGLVVLRPANSAQTSSTVASASAATTASARGSSQAASAPTSPAPSASTSQSAASPTADGSPTAAAGSTVAASGGGAGSPVADLAALNPVQQTNIGDLATGPEQIGSTTYEDSVRFTCDTDNGGSQANIVYDVAGYKFLTTIFGVPSDATNAAGNNMTLTFFKDGSSTQLAKPITISLDQPQPVHLDLQGTSQLEIACTATSATDRSNAFMDVVMANATIGPS